MGWREAVAPLTQKYILILNFKLINRIPFLVKNWPILLGKNIRHHSYIVLLRHIENMNTLLFTLFIKRHQSLGNLGILLRLEILFSRLRIIILQRYIKSLNVSSLLFFRKCISTPQNLNMCKEDYALN